MAYRFGVNLVMYALTGNYKSDQVHVPAIMERLGNERETGTSGARRLGAFAAGRPSFVPVPPLPRKRDNR